MLFVGLRYAGAFLVRPGPLGAGPLSFINSHPVTRTAPATLLSPSGWGFLRAARITIGSLIPSVQRGEMQNNPLRRLTNLPRAWCLNLLTSRGWRSKARQKE